MIESKLDQPYFKKNLERILRDIDQYNDSEMALALTRLAHVANSDDASEEMDRLRDAS